MSENAQSREATCPDCATVLAVADADAAFWRRCPKCNRPFVPAEQWARAAERPTPAIKPVASQAGPRLVPPSQESLLVSMSRLAVVMLRMWVVFMSARNLFWIRFYNLWDTAFYLVVIAAMWRPRWFVATDD